MIKYLWITQLRLNHLRWYGGVPCLIWPTAAKWCHQDVCYLPLKCVKNKLSADILRSLYFALVHPYYEYANIVWAVRNAVVLQKLFITQKRAVRIITNSPWNAHTYPLFRKKHVYLQPGIT